MKNEPHEKVIDFSFQLRLLFDVQVRVKMKPTTEQPQIYYFHEPAMQSVKSHLKQIRKRTLFG